MILSGLTYKAAMILQINHCRLNLTLKYIPYLTAMDVHAAVELECQDPRRPPARSTRCAGVLPMGSPRSRPCTLCTCLLGEAQAVLAAPLPASAPAS